MSGRTLPRFALVGLLAASFAAPAVAQTPVAPMPREKAAWEIEFGVEIGSGPRLFGRGLELSFDFTAPVVPPCCAFDRPVTVAAPMPREAGCNPVLHGVVVSTDGWNTTNFHVHPFPAARFADGVPHGTPSVSNIEIGCWGVEKRVVLPPSPAVQRCEGVVRWTLAPPARPGSCPVQCEGTAPVAAMHHVFPYPLVDVTGTWWVVTPGVPQPKHVQVVRPENVAGGPRPPWVPPAFASTPPPAGCAPVPQASRGAAVGVLSGAGVGVTIGSSVDRPVPVPDRSGKLAGTWVRDLDGIVIAATFTGDELKLCVTQQAELGDGEAATTTFTLTADYAVTKEGLVHGVVTGIDLDVKSGAKTAGGFASELAESAAALQSAVDSPFAFRVKHTSAGMMVSNIKFAGIEGVSGKELALMGGLYKLSKDGTVAAPKRMKPQAYSGGMTLPSGRYLEGHYQYFSPDPQHPLPRELASQEDPEGAARRAGGAGGVVPAPAPPLMKENSRLPGCEPELPKKVYCGIGLGRPATPQAVWNPAPPLNMPAGDFGMMADVFGQMLGVRQPQPAPQLLPPPLPQPATYGGPVQPTVGMTYSPPAPPPFAAPDPVPVVKPLVGTWVREVGPVVYVVKIAHDHLTITATAASEVEGGKVTTEGMILTADYHLGRDGTSIVGLITAVDAAFDGHIPEDAEFPRLGDELARVQKSLTDKPFALGVRVYGDVLVIGNVRLPAVEGERGAWSPLAVLGGRYAAAGNKPLPKPRAVKVTGPRTAPPPPPLAYDLPVRGPDSGLIPPTALLPGQRVPAPVPDDRIPPRASESPLPTPVPPMTAPIPLEDAKPGKKGKKKATPPDERMKQLLYQSEDLRRIKNEWERFWRNDRPSHMTPERIHGGIY